MDGYAGTPEGRLQRMPPGYVVGVIPVGPQSGCRVEWIGGALNGGAAGDEAGGNGTATTPGRSSSRSLSRRSRQFALLAPQGATERAVRGMLSRAAGNAEAWSAVEQEAAAAAAGHETARAANGAESGGGSGGGGPLCCALVAEVGARESVDAWREAFGRLQPASEAAAGPGEPEALLKR